MLTMAIGIAIAAGSANSHWLFSSEVDPITDAKASRVITRSRSGELLAVKCDSPGYGSVYIQVIANEMLASNRDSADVRDLTYRFDRGTPVTERWRYQGRSAFTARPLGNDVPGFVRGLRSSGTLALRIKDIDNQDLDLTFDLRQSATAMAKIFAACDDHPPG